MNISWKPLGRNRWAIAALAGVLLLAPGGRSLAAPDDALIPLDRYTSPKGKTLASTYKAELVQFYEHVYNCLPWLAIRKQTLGFPKPKGVEADDRYLSVMINVDQMDPDGSFAALPRERRISAMFSRHGVYLLRQMVAMTNVASDANLAGYGVALSWPKPASPAAQPVTETLALFVDKSSLIEYLAKRLPPSEFASRAKLTLWEGNEPAGPVKLDIWEDTFNSTYKLKNYEPPQGSKCSE